MPASTYTGRFAPSPTGPLHFGSLCAALASFLDARAAGGRWLLRIDDIDPPREVTGAADAIIGSLQQHGLLWDGDIVWQSSRIEHYRAALRALVDRGLAFPCTCSASLLKRRGQLHRGNCHSTDGDDVAWRLRVSEGEVGFDDRLQGYYAQDLAREIGDVVIWRRDGCVAYQLAVVVDDGAAAVTDIVRGTDLIDSTPRQIALQRLLDLPQPRYLHLPVAAHADGSKLSKQTHAPPIDDGQPVANLQAALAFLGQPQATGNSPSALLTMAVAQWQPQSIPRQIAISV